MEIDWGKPVRRFVLPLVSLVIAVAVAIHLGLDSELERLVDRYLGPYQSDLNDQLVAEVEGLSEERPRLLLSENLTGQWDFACVVQTMERAADDKLAQGILRTPNGGKSVYTIVLFRGEKSQLHRLSHERVGSVERIESMAGQGCYDTVALQFEFVKRDEAGRLILRVRAAE